MGKNEKTDPVEAYIGQFSEPIQVLLRGLRATIREVASEAEERISYRMPAYFLGGPLVYFAAFARHIGFYPTASGIASFESELSAYKHAKGSVQFPLDKPLPLDLVARIVKFKAKENRSKPAKSASVTARISPGTERRA